MGTDTIIDSDFATAAAAVAPAKLSELDLPGYLNGPEVPRCGYLQRVSVWEGDNATCASAVAELGYTPSTFNLDRRESTSEFPTATGQAGCYVKEPLTLVPKCTAPNSSCNAGWQRVPGASKPALRRIERPLVHPFTWR